MKQLKNLTQADVKNGLDRAFKNPAFPGIILIVVSFIAIVWANSWFGDRYFAIWENKISVGFEDIVISKSLHHWINDGLMAMFFFVIGLEIKREVMAGELSTWKKATMPVFAALGGMVVPSFIFFLFNIGKPSSNGWGIPMATDIAFSLGILALLGKRVPLSLKIFLTALAIADDLGAVLVIAFFYSSKIFFSSILLASSVLVFMIMLNILEYRNKLVYAITGILGIWLAFLVSGVHPTIAGVLAAFVIPANTRISLPRFKQTLISLTYGIKIFEKKETPFLSKTEQQAVTDIEEICEQYEPPLQSLERSLRPWVIYLIMPVFALSNTGVLLSGSIFPALSSSAGLGIILGLVVGKPLGIVSFCWLANKTGLADLPDNVTWKHILGVGMLGGIGFTMALFVSGLAFIDNELLNQAKISILFASVLAGVAGYYILKKTLPPIS